jgi:hypothetical protein
VLGFAELAFTARTAALLPAPSFTLAALPRAGAFAAGHFAGAFAAGCFAGAFAEARFAGAPPLAAARFGSVFVPPRVTATDFFTELGLARGLGLPEALDLARELDLTGALGLLDGFDFFAPRACAGFAGTAPPLATELFFAGWLAAPRTGAAFFVFFVAMSSIVRRIARHTRALDIVARRRALQRRTAPPCLCVPFHRRRTDLKTTLIQCFTLVPGYLRVVAEALRSRGRSDA